MRATVDKFCEYEKVVFGIYGAGSFARELAPVLKMQLAQKEDILSGVDVEVCFVETEPSRSMVGSWPVVSEAAFMSLECEAKFFNVALGDSGHRRRLAEKLLDCGAVPVEIRSPDCIEYERNRIAEGAIFCAHTMITSDATIGKFFQCNIYSYVAHDCVVGDYVTFAPRVCCNGNVQIGDGAYIGTGAILRPGSPGRPLIIGANSVIGMGAVVTKDVPEGVTVYGNPAHIGK